MANSANASPSEQLRRQAAFREMLIDTFTLAVERIRRGDRRMFEHFLRTVDDTIDVENADMAATLAAIDANPEMWLSLFAHGIVRMMENR